MVKKTPPTITWKAKNVFPENQHAETNATYSPLKDANIPPERHGRAGRQHDKIFLFI